jgi:hypothetical protein
MALPAAAQNWVDITPGGTSPPARAWASAVHDAQNDRMVIFGGRGVGGDRNDVWAYDLDSGTWADLTPGSGSAPAPRRTPGSVYDPAGHRMVTWSGQAGTFFNDAWTFDLAGGTWTLLAPSGGPPAIRYGVAVTYDPVVGDLVTFAGFTSSGRFDDTWRLNAAAATWTDVTPVSSPLERCLHSACYDAVGRRMIMYGGQNAGPLGDLWAFDLAANTWSELTPPSGPPARFFASNVYDARNRRVTIFGGNTGSLQNDAWVFDLWTGAWTMLAPTGTPPAAREGAAAIYDEAGDRMLVFGGNNGSYQNDLWALENLSGTATSVRPERGPAASGVVLHPGAPNPFHPQTNLRFELTRESRATLRVYDVRGRAVRTLVSGFLGAGEHRATWDGRDDAGVRVASGVYLLRLETPHGGQTRSLVLLR